MPSIRLDLVGRDGDVADGVAVLLALQVRRGTAVGADEAERALQQREVERGGAVPVLEAAVRGRRRDEGDPVVRKRV